MALLALKEKQKNETQRQSQVISPSCPSALENIPELVKPSKTSVSYKTFAFRWVFGGHPDDLLKA